PDPSSPGEIKEADLQTYVATADPTPIPKFSFRRFFTKDKYGRAITFYLSKPKKPESVKPVPLVVCIQGSGSQSVFLRYQGMIASGGPESVVFREFGDQVRVLVAEKPGVEFLVQPERPGSAEEGPEAFNREFSLQRWVEALNAATEATLKMDEIDTASVLALGHSEGAQVACTLAAVNANITHVAAMAGGGPTQLHDLIQFARRGEMYDPNQTPDERVEALLADWKKVMDAPEAHDQFILGHSHLRWSTFCAVSPIDALKRTKAKVFIAQGSADTNSLPESAVMLYAELLARGRDVTYHRVENGDHAFMTPEDSTGAGWSSTNAKAVEWFLADATNKH
ncbi:MAG: alpha/beta fold hydrolase, partial [Planctomycetota bacterium]